MPAAELRQVMEEQLKLSRRLRARVAELEQAAHEPLAVVGMALRLPGGLTTPEAYWDFLLGDEHALSEIPADRRGLRSVYDERVGQPGRSYVRRAGFLRDIGQFDAGFFGISQREAESLDPQQRLLLETAWEAMERAGIAVRRQDRLPAGVFVGIMSAEYGQRLANRSEGVDPYYGTGGGHCFAAGRVSYALGLSGPALSVDTACSSSLVALHLGAQSLRRGECRYALVGGANLVLSPDLMVSLCQSGALAQDGRCKTFTAAADGYGRGEGVGMIVLMRLADARRERRPILAVLRGTAVNHDGASSGLTVPSGPAQEEVIRAALADARVEPQDVGWVEAHGTGTSLGDPIEIGALDAVVGTGAPERTTPLSIGTVKTRIGHLEAAAGIAALVKVVLMLRHGVMPPSLAPTDSPLNPLIPWEQLNVAVPRHAQPWPETLARRVAGISAFGLSGTNAHVVLEAYEPEPEPVAETAGPRPELVVLSAKDPESLRGLAGTVGRYLGGLDQGCLPSAAHTLRVGRAHFGWRIAVAATTPAEFAERLADAAEQIPHSAVRASAATPALRIGPIVERNIDALAEVFPRLADAAADARDGDCAGDTAGAGGPEQRLTAMLRRLGIHAAITSDPNLMPGDVWLHWGDISCRLLGGLPGRAAALLLDALAVLFTSGLDLRLDAVQAHGARLLGEVPTYAFHRKLFWIDEPAFGSISGPVTDDRPNGHSVSLRMPESNAIVAHLLAELKGVLHADDDLDDSMSFLDVGGDSFTAMLFVKDVERHYGVELTADDMTEMTDLPISLWLGGFADTIIQNLHGDAEQVGAQESRA